MPPSVPVLPNFFIVGAPKAGTTSLYHSLDQHPQIFMSPIKEPCYFASEVRPQNFSEEHAHWAHREALSLQKYFSEPVLERRFGGMVTEWEDYLKLFQNAAEAKAIGEASVCYLWSRTAAANIACRIPDARIIMILRDPAERAFSQYLHTVTNGLVHRSFREQIERGLRRSDEKFGILHPFLECGLYYQQIKRYLDLFPSENVRIYLYEEQREQITLEILRFLNVDSSLIPDTSQRRLEARVPRAIAAGYFLKKYGVWQRARDLSPGALRPILRTLVFKKRPAVMMDPEDRRYLVDYYREDIGKVSSLLDRDLSAWLR
jgi:hypothetical protein